MNSALQFTHPVLLSRELKKKPVQIRLAGTPYVLYRDHTGTAHALLDRCPHRFAPLSSGKVRPDGRLACGYHGWHFDAKGCGQSATQPNLGCQVPMCTLVEKYGFLWLTGPENTVKIPEVTDTNFSFCGALSSKFEAPLHVSLDNFSEDEHTPFVHTRLGWGENHLDGVEFESFNHADSTEVYYRAPQRDNLLGKLIFKAGDIFHNSWRTYFDPPRIIYQLHWTDSTRAIRRRPEVIVHIFFVPWDEKSTRVNAVVYRKPLAGEWLLKPILRPLLDRLMTYSVSHEVEADSEFVKQLADTPLEMRGMRLGKFDKPIVHNHKLLKKIYWGETADEDEKNETEENATTNGTPIPVLLGENESH